MVGKASANAWGFAIMDEIADKVRRVRDGGGRYPRSCADARGIDERLGELTGPRMWAFINAAAPGEWPENNPAITRRLKERAERRAYVNSLYKAAKEAGVTFIPG